MGKMGSRCDEGEEKPVISFRRGLGVLLPFTNSDHENFLKKGPNLSQELIRVVSFPCYINYLFQ